MVQELLGLSRDLTTQALDVDDAFALAHAITMREAPALSNCDREDCVAYLAEEAWRLSLAFDPSRSSFAAFCGVRLQQRMVDWIRTRHGRRVWKFRSHTYTRPRIDLVSLDGGDDPLGDSVARSQAILRTVATPVSQGSSPAEIAKALGMRKSWVLNCLDELRNELRGELEQFDE